MAIRIRPTRSEAEFGDALAAIGHYFGRGVSSEESLRNFARLLPHDRMHAAFDGKAIVGGAGVFPFDLTVPGGPIACAGVTVCAVLPTHRRRGIFDRLMRAQLGDVRERGECIAALWASEETIYGRFGYGLASQDAMIEATRRHAELRTDLPGKIGATRLVTHDEAVKQFPRVYDRVQRRSTGFCSRSKAWWEVRRLDDRPERRGDAGELNRLLLEIDGRPVGYALYRIKLEWEGGLNASQVIVIEAVGETPAATRELWRYLLAIDWVDSIHCELLSVDHPLFLLVQRPNRLRWRVLDGLWLRLVDVRAALSSRAVVGDGRVTFDVVADPIFPDNVGTWTVGGDGVKRSGRRADLRLDVQALACAYLGGFTFAELVRAGRVEEVTRGGLARADALYRVDAKPWCPEIF